MIGYWQELTIIRTDGLNRTEDLKIDSEGIAGPALIIIQCFNLSPVMILFDSRTFHTYFHITTTSNID